MHGQYIFNNPKKLEVSYNYNTLLHTVAHFLDIVQQFTEKKHCLCGMCVGGMVYLISITHKSKVIYGGTLVAWLRRHTPIPLLLRHHPCST
jgi:poly(3-hydroxyalkanoate) synthetase